MMNFLHNGIYNKKEPVVTSDSNEKARINKRMLQLERR